MPSVSSVIVHNRLRYELGRGNANWQSNTWRGALFLKGAWTPDADDDYVQTIVTAGASELSGGGYARVTLGSKTVTLDDPNDAAPWSCAVLDFGIIAAGGAQDDYDALVVYRLVTDDTDSWLAFTYQLDSVVTTSGIEVVFSPSTSGIAQII